MNGSLPAPLNQTLSRQEYWNLLPFYTPGDLLNTGIKPTSVASPSLAGGFFTTVPPEKPCSVHVSVCVYVWLEEEIWMFYFCRGTNWVSLRKKNVFPDFWFVLVGFKNSFIPFIIVLNFSFYLHKFLVFNITSCLLVLARVWNLIQK